MDPSNGGIPQAAGQRQHDDSRERIEPIGLDDHRQARLTTVPLQGNDDDIAASCQSRSFQASALTLSQKSVSDRPSSVFSASAITSHWRRHSAAKPGTRVSGTQIWTGRRPAARILSRRRLTRSALLDLSISLHVASPRPVGKIANVAEPATHLLSVNRHSRLRRRGWLTARHQPTSPT
jgi:hypothetical protein